MVIVSELSFRIGMRELAMSPDQKKELKRIEKKVAVFMSCPKTLKSIQSRSKQIHKTIRIINEVSTVDPRDLDEPVAI